jgi:hypothetical protein
MSFIVMCATMRRSRLLFLFLPLLVTQLAMAQAPPVINNILPRAAIIGSTVTIQGSGFGNDVAGVTVYFGAVKASVQTVTDNSLTVLVPAGATYAPVSVTHNYLTGYTAFPFTPLAPVAGTITFKAFSNLFNIGTNYWHKAPLNPVAADLDGDGRVDLVLPDSTTGSLYVSLNTTTTTGYVTFSPSQAFPPPVSYPVPPAVTQAIIADLDGDGRLDMILKSNITQVYLNVSQPGTLAFSNITTVPGSLRAVADMDQDGKPDIIVNDTVNGHFVTAFLKNNCGAGLVSFNEVPMPGIPTGSNYLVTDLNNDSKPDLVISSDTSDVITLLQNTGNFLFSPPATFTAAVPSRLVAGDIDGDGLQDLAITSRKGFRILAYRNTGNFVFSKAFDITNITTNDLALGDLNGDGHPDLVATEGANANLQLYQNNSTPGNITFAQPVTLIYSQQNQNGICLADMDNDGKTDVLIGTGSPQLFSGYYNNSVPSPVIYSFIPGMGVAGTAVTIHGSFFTGTTAVTFGGVAASDFTIQNDSTILTHVSAAAVSGAVAVTNVYGTNSRQWFVAGQAPLITSFAPLTGPVGSQVTVHGKYFGSTANLTVYMGGIKTSIVSSNDSTAVIVVPAGMTYSPITINTQGLSATANTVFTPTFPHDAIKPLFSAATFGGRFKIATLGIGGIAADVDGDGKTDLLYYNYSVDYTYALQVSLNQSRVDSFSFRDTSITTVNNPAVSMLADMDGDGRPDLAGFGYNGGNFFIHRNTSTPGHASFNDGYSGLFNGYNMAISDLDGDGKPDVIFPDLNREAITLLRNSSTNGKITMDPAVKLIVKGLPANISIADFDGDGKPDITFGVDAFNVTPSQGPVVLRNISQPGLLQFETPTYVDHLPIGAVTRTADLNHDGKPDLIVVESNYGPPISTRTYLNNSTPGHLQFILQTPPNTSRYNAAFEFGDFDGDGNTDILANNYDSVNIWATNAQYIYAGSGSNDYSVLRGSTGADMDGDGKPDLVTFTSDGHAYVLRNRMGEFTIRYVCAMHDTTLTAATTGTIYQWQVDNGNGYTNLTDDSLHTGTATKSLLLKKIDSLQNGYAYRCVVDGKTGKGLVLEVQTAATPKVSISSNITGPVCPNASLVFNATTVNGGSQPHFKWYMNNQLVGKDSSAFIPDSVTNDFRIEVYMSSDPNGCVASQTVSDVISVKVLTDNNVPTLNLSITSPACTPGDMLHYQVTASDNQVYDYVYLKNGIPVSSDAFAQAQNGDSLQVRLDYVTKCTAQSVQRFSNKVLIANSIRPSYSIDIPNEECIGAYNVFAFNSPDADNLTEVTLWESIDDGAFEALTTQSLINHSASFPLTNNKPGNIKRFYFTTTPNVGSCQESDTTEIFTVQNYTTVTPIIKAQDRTMTIINPQDGYTYTWEIQVAGQDTNHLFIPVVPASHANSYTPDSIGIYRVHSFDGHCDSYSDTITGIPNAEGARHGVNAYPNPVEDQLVLDKLQLSDNWETLDILNIDGTAVQQAIPVKGKTKVTVPLGSLQPGMYYAVLHRKTGTKATIRFMKM